MSRYIDIDDLPTGRVEWDDIFDAPSIDIVFCRECHWARPRSLPGETGYRCVLHRIWKGENGFCDSGEREGE